MRSPISSDRATTVEVLAAVAAAGVPLQVGFHRRFDPDWVSVAHSNTWPWPRTRRWLQVVLPEHEGHRDVAAIVQHLTRVARWLVGALAAVR